VGNTLDANEFQAARTKHKRADLLPRGRLSLGRPRTVRPGVKAWRCAVYRLTIQTHRIPVAGPRMLPAPETAADRFFALITRSELWPTTMLAGAISAKFSQLG
jgi:hypothetical protein